MSLNPRRRTLGVILGCTLCLAACAGDTAEPTATSASASATAGTVSTDPTPAATCADLPAADTTTPQGWLGWIAEHPGEVSLAFDDGNGTVVEHRAGDPQPLASAVKVVHLAAYADAAATGTLDPAEPVAVSDWERWYLPGLDGGAHPAALERLGVPHNGVRATDPTATVTLNQLVSAMIQESDNAAPDYLRALLGDQALVDAAAGGGWTDVAPPSLLGSALLLLDPSVGDATTAARRYSEDPAYRAQIQALPAPGLEAQVAWAAQTWSGSAEDLAGLHRAISSGDLGPGAELARGQLEWQSAPEDLRGVGFKGGALPGVLTEAITLRRTDGTTASAVLLVRGLGVQEWGAALSNGLPHQQLLLAAMTDLEVAGQLACTV